jgi:hypothetical protein
MAHRNVLLDGGASRKAVNLWGDEGWVTIGGGDDERRKGVDAYYAAVPWLFRGVKSRSTDVSHVPFALVLGDEAVATSDKWQPDALPTAVKRDIEFLHNPRKLFAQLEQSLTMCARAYILLTTNPSGYIKSARYLNPYTVTPINKKDENGNETGEIEKYERRVGNRKLDLKPENVVAIYDPDYLTETGAGTSPAKVALAASGVLFNADVFIANYFERGAIKATILSADTPDQGEAKALQAWFSDVIGGIKNAWSAKVMRAKIVTPIVIGEGLEGLQNTDLTKEKRQDIATALGIPESRMWSAAANYATRSEDEVAYYRGTIIPECDLITEAFNEQVFNEFHHLEQYRLEFKPEGLDIFQEDETARAGSLGQLVSALQDPISEIAMVILGYEIDDETMAKLRVYWADKTKRAEAVVANMAQGGDSNNQPNPQTADQEEGGENAQGEKPNGQATRSALFQWRKCALTAIKKGEAAAVEFDNPAIPDRVAQYLRYELAGAKTREDVDHLFDTARKMAKDTENVDPLVLELRRANELLSLSATLGG